MINKKYLKIARERNINNFNKFIYNKLSNILIDSIDITKVDYKTILQLGINENKVYNYLKIRNKNSKVIFNDLSTKNYDSNETNIFESSLDNWSFKKNEFDLIYSNFYLHLSDNFENLLRNIRDSLVHNGFFIALIPDKDNFYQIRNSLLKTDINIYNGAFNRFNPIPQIDEIIKFFKLLNFEIPVVDTDTIKLQYKSFNQLIIDVRSLKQPYAESDKKLIFEKKIILEL